MPPDDTTPPPPPAAPPADPPDGMFAASYVRDLRAENATFRVRAKEAAAALTQVGELLGLDATAVADPARVQAAASTLRLAADLEAGIVRHGLDRKLALAVIAQERALTDVQAGAPDTGSRLDEILTRLAKENPALKVALVAGPPRSGLPLTGGGAGNAPQISRAELANLPAERVEQLRKAGLLNHLLRGGS